MLNEEKAAKKKIVDSLEHHTKQARKLCKELGIRSDYFTSLIAHHHLPILSYVSCIVTIMVMSELYYMRASYRSGSGNCNQCCGSRCLSQIPDPNFFHPGYRIRIFSIPDHVYKFFNPKNWFLTVLWLLNDLLSLKTDLNVTTVIISKKSIFC